MKLEEIRAMCDAATPGPWKWHDVDGNLQNPDRKAILDGDWGVVAKDCDRAFIAAARELVPKLLAVARVATKVSDCVAEFGKEGDGACACHEWFSALDDALAALESP